MGWRVLHFFTTLQVRKGLSHLSFPLGFNNHWFNTPPCTRPCAQWFSEHLNLSPSSLRKWADVWGHRRWSDVLRGLQGKGRRAPVLAIQLQTQYLWTSSPPGASQGQIRSWAIHHKGYAGSSDIFSNVVFQNPFFILSLAQGLPYHLMPHPTTLRMIFQDSRLSPSPLSPLSASQ